jgi:hypothetical protein
MPLGAWTGADETALDSGAAGLPWEARGRVLTPHHRAAVRSAIWTPAAEGGPGRPADWAARVCGASVQLLAARGTAVTATAADGGRRLLAASDFSSRAIEDAQVTVRQGPTLDAADGDRAVLAPDLADDGHTRWPSFTKRALARGVAAVFAFPLRAGTVRLGVLTVYRGGPGMLTVDERGIAEALAEVLVDGLVEGGPGRL